MRIAFDLRPAFFPNSRRRGIGRHARELGRALVTYTEHEYLFYSLGKDCIDLPGKFECKPLWHLRRPSRLNWLVDRYRLPLRLARDRPSLFHATDITAVPRSAPCPVWATVHDMIPFLFWKEVEQGVAWDYRQALLQSRGCIENADRVITVSHCTKQDLVRLWEVDPDRVDVVHSGVSVRPSPLGRRQARQHLARLYGISERFVLYLGGSDFRKNLTRLLRAFGRLRNDGYSGQLVLAGETFLRPIAEVRRLRTEIGRMRLQDSVSTPGFLPDEELSHFFRACDCFVFPSLYEGFGLPVLEALQCEAPVACSDSSSLPEVAGEAATYFDPEDEEAIAEALASIVGDATLSERLRKLGPSQARKFSWERAARQLDTLYRKHIT